MKEGKVFKRILAIALVVVMTITMVPFGVFAEGTGTPAACEHVWGTAVAETNSTCKVAGVIAYTPCTKCDAKKGADGTILATVTKPLADHTWTNATCTAPKTCSVCNLTEGAALGHTGGTATCLVKAKCTRCNEFYGDKANHPYSTEFTVDRDPACTTEGSKSRHCTTATCTAKTDVTPIAATGHNFDKTKADGKCTAADCNAVCTHAGSLVEIPEIKATCTAKGSKGGYECNVCGKVVIDPVSTDALGHDLEKFTGKAPTCTEAGKSKGEKCNRTGCTYEVAQQDLAALGHSWSTTKQVVREATCTSTGAKAIVCTREGCKEVKEGTVEEIPMTAHAWEATKTITKKETCEADGEKAILCKDCKAKKTDSIEVIKKLGHDWDEGTVKVAPDCKKEGTTTFKCKRTDCGKVEDRKVDKLDCDYEEKIKEPTCEEDGYSTFTCKMCKSSYVDKKVDKFGHSFVTYVQDENTATCYSDGTKTAECDHGCGKKNTIADEGSKIDHTMTDFTEIKKATCTEEGEEEAKCFYYDKCGYSESYPTDALGHTIKDDTAYTVDVPATCTTAGSESKHCERCDYTEGAREIKALGHDFQPAEGTKATCTEGGYAKYKCTRCTETKEEANAEPLGHDFKYVSNNNATCKEDGTETGKCSRCDVTDTRTEAGSKLAHIPGEAVVVPATTKANGSSTTACTVCGEVIDEVEIAMIKSLSLKFTVATYNGNDRLPKLTITDADGNVLVKNQDYTVVTPTKEESAKIGQHKYDVTFMGNYEGEEEVTYKVLPGKTSKVSAEKKQTEIKLSWKEVKGATGYRVYVYNSKTKKYDIVAKYVKGKTSYTVKDLKANTTYKFAVKAYGKDDEGTVIWASESTKASFKTLVTKTSKVTATPAKTSVKLTWNKVSGADGYRVYVYNTKSKSYKTVATVDGKTTYTVKDLKAGTSYKFAVKAYDVVNEKKVWSNQSTTVSVKTTK